MLVSLAHSPTVVQLWAGRQQRTTMHFPPFLSMSVAFWLKLLPSSDDDDHGSTHFKQLSPNQTFPEIGDGYLLGANVPTHPCFKLGSCLPLLPPKSLSLVRNSAGTIASETLRGFVEYKLHLTTRVHGLPNN